MVTGETLEKDVERIYKLLGARTTERRKLIETYEIDVYALFNTGHIEYRVIVECKEYTKDKKVSDIDMRSFITKLLLAQHKKIAEIGVFVTTSGYSKDALKSASDYNIKCLTIDDLYNQLVDFEDYLHDVESNFTKSDLSKYYIDQTASDVEDYRSLLEAEFENVAHYPLVDYLLDLFIKDRIKRIAVLGNFGTGKTSLCNIFLKRLVEEYKADTKKRIPILISLKDFRSGLDIDQLITNHLQKLPGININLHLCKELQKLGRFIFILDGLDEMATKVDRIVINENLRELDRLYKEADNYYIITCRTHFFQERISDEFLIDYRVLYLTEWSGQDLEKYLKKRFSDEGQKFLKKINAYPAIKELARTPIFLDMIINTISRITEKDALNVLRLYKTYTDDWIEMQSKRRGSVMSSRQRAAFLAELSSKIYLSDRSTIHFTELYNVSKEISGYIDNTRIDYFDTDARTSTFITKDGEGNYGFFHPSFMEFFCAGKLIFEINEGNKNLISHKELSIEIFGFINFSLISEIGLKNLQEWSRHFSEKNLSRNAVQLLLRLGTDIDKEVEAFYKINKSAWNALDEVLETDNVDVINNFITENYTKMSRMIVIIKRQHPLEIENSDLDIEETISDFFIKLWSEKNLQKKSVLYESLNSDKYLYNTLRNIINDKIRFGRNNSDLFKKDFDEKVARAFSEWSEYEDPLDDPEQRQNVQLQAIYDALQIMPAKSRQLFLLVYRDGFSIREAADKMGLANTSVRNILHRIRSTIRKIIMDKNQSLF